VFFDRYARAHVKMSELGQEDILLSEFDNNTTKSGGYIEPPVDLRTFEPS
jgi:hypothetical protein